MTDKKPVNTGNNRKAGTFVKGDPRINRKGRPIKTFNALRKEWQDIFAEIMFDGDGKPMLDEVTGKALTRLKARMRVSTSSRNFQEFRTALEYAYGKPMTEIDLTSGGEINHIITVRREEKNKPDDK